MDKEFLLRQLDFICNKLNDLKLNYYVVGALGAYIDCNLEIIRKHGDIDIMVLEEDIDKISSIFDDSNYIFIDNRKCSNKFLNKNGFTEGEEHEVYAKYKDNDFHIGFFMYSCTDTEYSIIEYFKQNNIQMRLIRTLPIKFFEYQYDDTIKEYHGITLKTVRVECIYQNKKNMTREKDKYDNSIFKDYIKEDIISGMTGKGKYRTTKIEKII